MGRIRITQTKSVINRPETHKRTIRALGLRRMHQSVVHDDNPSIRGMIFQIRHLVEVEEIGGSSAED